MRAREWTRGGADATAAACELVEKWGDVLIRQLVREAPR